MTVVSKIFQKSMNLFFQKSDSIPNATNSIHLCMYWEREREREREIKISEVSESKNGIKMSSTIKIYFVSETHKKVKGKKKQIN